MTRLVHHEVARYEGKAAISNEELEVYAEQLIYLHKTILESGEAVRKSGDIYYIDVMPGITLCDLIYDPSLAKLSNDCLNNFRLMIDQSPLLGEEHFREASVIGTVGLFYSANEGALNVNSDWIHFVRADLSKNQKPVNDFYSDFKVAFPRLKFSNDFPACLNSFDGGHSSFSATITRCLSSLNDYWFYEGPGDLPKMLREFSTKCNFSTSLEGNGDRKPALTFTFSSGADSVEYVLCEPHMKLEYADNPGEYFFHRIYFSPCRHESFSNKILVGHAGKHL